MEIATKQQKQLIGLTFVFGLFSGAYMYLMVFLPAYHDGLLPKISFGDSSGNELSIKGSQYGYCLDSGYTCPAFELTNDGLLRSLPSVAIDEDDFVIEVELTSNNIQTLRNALKDAPLEEYALQSSMTDCSVSEADEYRYTITLGTESYVLDTCATEYPIDSGLQVTLYSLFQE